MKYSVGYIFIKLPGDVCDIFWHYVVSQYSPEGLPIDAFECNLIVDEDDVEG
ncbi:hypothetical protein DPMN_069820 [Dreissena polymorpha]|uniref:Uncharacterized protein n=1 Tax=Dreissena polymorpha TaxID=45954 RepID=A0A9D4BX32_DREPO|nr:hypothetical protein DPMN_069820 [Dreissena polymorpha]